MSSVCKQAASLLSMGLSMALLGGCMATPENVRPTVQTAVSKSSNTYVVKRASIRKPGNERPQSQPVPQSPVPVRPYVPTRSAAPVAVVAPRLTREQYQARFEAEQRAKKAEAERLRLAKIAAEQRRKKYEAERRRQEAELEAKRRVYKAEWDKKQAALKVQKERARVMDKKVESVIANAKQHIGKKYVWGGDTPSTGFDCSGLVQYSLKTGANVRIPRTAAEQYAAAVKILSSQATRGDLVFFRTRGRGVSHVGIYLGSGRFLHAPSTGKTITTTQISGYWKDRLVGFGRIPGACKIPLPV